MLTDELFQIRMDGLGAKICQMLTDAIFLADSFILLLPSVELPLISAVGKWPADVGTLEVAAPRLGIQSGAKALLGITEFLVEGGAAHCLEDLLDHGIVRGNGDDDDQCAKNERDRGPLSRARPQRTPLPFDALPSS